MLGGSDSGVKEQVIKFMGMAYVKFVMPIFMKRYHHLYTTYNNK